MTAPARRRRYAICGLSNRGLHAYARPLLGDTGGRDGGLGFGEVADDWSQTGELVAVVDADLDRARQFAARCEGVEVFGAEELPVMIERCRPDVVIVTGPDATHARHVVEALGAGVEVIVEKPMTATAAQAVEVLAAARRAPAPLTVTHNMRYTPRHRALRQLIMDGAVGRPVQVTLDYHVDTRHGASYFVRWNRHQQMSGTLAVHKSCHHLDLIGWLLDDRPASVYARGGRSFYGAASPHRPLADDGAVLTVDQQLARDPYYADQGEGRVFPEPSDAPRLGAGGLSYPRQYPGGTPWTVFDDDIDVEDHYTAIVGYRRGASLAYTIDFSSPWEGYRLGISGTHGRLEAVYGHDRDGRPMPGADHLVHQPLFAAARTIPIASGGGGHDGSDERMRRDLFGDPSPESIALGLVATVEQAADAVATGEAIWRSARSGQPVVVADLLTG